MNHKPFPINHSPSQDQVILPTGIAFGICLRGIKTRLGRSVITLSGVGLGIAFLASVVSGFHIKRALRHEADLIRDIERRIVATRGEIGMLRGKDALVVLKRPAATDSGFIKKLLEQGAAVSVATDGELPAGAVAAKLPEAADNADAVILLGEYESLLSEQLSASLKGRRVLVFDDPGPAGRDGLEKAGVGVKKLGVQPRPDEIAREREKERGALYRMYWIVAVSLLITVGGISNAMLMSVTERFREIATMKCLGALSSFVVKMFLIESSLMGMIGSVLGCVVGMSFSLLAYSYTFEFGKVLGAVSYPILGVSAGACALVGVALAIVAGIYPARVAAKMIPAAALSSHV